MLEHVILCRVTSRGAVCVILLTNGQVHVSLSEYFTEFADIIDRLMTFADQVCVAGTFVLIVSTTR